MDRGSDIVQEVVTKTIPKKRKCKKAKWLTEEALQIAEKRREANGKGEREGQTQLNTEFQLQQGETRKPSWVNSANKQNRTIEWERLEISSRKLEIPKMGTIKDRNSKDLTEAEQIKKRWINIKRNCTKKL